MDFIRRYRLSKVLVHNLCKDLRPLMPVPTKSKDLSVETKVSSIYSHKYLPTYLFFLIKSPQLRPLLGTYKILIGFNFKVGTYILIYNTYISLFKVLTALSFFATGSYQKPAGDIHGHSMAQQTVSSVVAQVTAAMNSPQMRRKCIKFPRTVPEQQENILR